MSSFRLTSDAENDLNLIWDFIAQDNLEAANRVLNELQGAMELLAEMPEMAQKRPGLSKIYPNLRAWPLPDYPNYLVFYLPVEDRIMVIRILHGARNIVDIFGE